jgi:hypothetical protein
MKEHLWDKWWAMSFSLLFKFEIENERNDMVMELPEPLIDWGEYYDWNEWHDYMLCLLQRQQKKKKGVNNW